jgi:ubiquinone/menaquinone biosynthesis C-methylase UbiE
LDIGCGDGKKTSLFSKYVKVASQNIYCTDIETWGPYQKNKKELECKFKYIENNKLNYLDNEFDIITCILTLHHIQNMEDFIKEIYRIIKPGGYLLLIEHSIYTDYDRLFVNMQHLLFSALYDGKKDYVKNPDYIYCYNMYEWNFILEKNGFKFKKEDVVVFKNEYNINYDNIFYGFFTKPIKQNK